MQKRSVIFILIILLILGAAGCTNSEDTEKSAETASGNKGENPYPLSVTDVTGRQVQIEEEPKRVVSLSPAATEILFKLGLSEKIVGVTEYCDYPEEALDKPKVGGFENPNMEVIIDMEPDVVFTSAGIQEDLINQLEELGITAVVLDAEEIDGVLDNILLAGRITNSYEKAKALVAELTKRIEAVDKKISRATSKPDVFFEVWDDPLMSAGPGSFIHDLIVRAGGRNIAEDAVERYPKFSVEILLERNPDIYIVNSHAHTPRDVKNREGYEVLKAVQNNRVYSIEDDLVTLPGPRIVDGLEEMAEIIHPELFEE